MTQDRYAGLDGLRGIAALLVLITHLSNADMNVIPGINLTGMGRMGLWLFFVLSAFLLTDQALLAAKQPRYGAWTAQYFGRRFFRIYPLLLFALLLDAASGRVTATEFVRTLALVDGPGIYWTIPPEFQFYFVIPVIGLAFAYSPVIGVLFCVALMAGAVLIKLPLIGWQYLTLFVGGSLLAYIWQSHRGVARMVAWLAIPAVVLMVAMIPLLVRLWAPGIDPFAPRGNWHYFSIIWAPVLFAAALGFKGTRFLGSAPMAYLGRISFGVYLLHPIVISACGMLGFKIGILVGLLSVAFAALMHHLLEEPARRFGYRTSSRLLPRPL